MPLFGTFIWNPCGTWNLWVWNVYYVERSWSCCGGFHPRPWDSIWASPKMLHWWNVAPSASIRSLKCLGNCRLHQIFCFGKNTSKIQGGSFAIGFIYVLKSLQQNISWMLLVGWNAFTCGKWTIQRDHLAPTMPNYPALPTILWSSTSKWSENVWSPEKQWQNCCLLQSAVGWKVGCLDQPHWQIEIHKHSMLILESLEKSSNNTIFRLPDSENTVVIPKIPSIYPSHWFIYPPKMNNSKAQSSCPEMELWGRSVSTWSLCPVEYSKPHKSPESRAKGYDLGSKLCA